VPDRAVAAAVADAHAEHWAFVLAATVRVTADLDLAEECVQVAFTRALSAWQDRGIPTRPVAWLTTTARNAAIDELRRATALARRLPLLVEEESAPSFAWGRGYEIDDDRLRLIFTCCHPALATEAQLALTLRCVCGLNTPEIARAFLVSDATMAARITRAKRKISQARIPFRTPPLAELPARISTVLQVVHLVFTTGHTATGGEALVRDDLVDRAISLAKMLRELLPTDLGVAGLLGLLLLTDARRASRLVDGRLVLLEDQDRSRWDREAIELGSSLVREALEADPPSRYTLLGAIAELHDAAPSWEETDWRAIVRCYDLLDELWPSPVVSLNRAVAVGFASGPRAGIRLLDALADEPRLATYPYFAAARAGLARRAGDLGAARNFYEEALALSDNEVERSYLTRRLAEIDEGAGTPSA
jgi:RNA polymerase sigma factor (sigma-70 family)